MTESRTKMSEKSLPTLTRKSHKPPPAKSVDTTYWKNVRKRFEQSEYNLDEHPAVIIRKVHQQATAIFNGLFAGLDITSTQLAALSVIIKEGSISQNQLGRQTAMDPSTISMVVRKLIKSGLAERAASDTDMRLSMIAPTARGAEFGLQLLERSEEVGHKLLEPLSPGERLLLMELLKRLIHG